MNHSFFFIFRIFTIILLTSSFSFCGPDGETGTEEKPPAANPDGIGPVSSFEPGQINPEMVKQGKELFENKCSACHRIGERYVGPDLKGITQRRSSAWILNMILNPEEMTKKDPVARGLLEEYLAQMTWQNVTEDQAKSILDFFRSEDSGSP